MGRYSGDDGPDQALVLLPGNSGPSIARDVKVVFDPAPPATVDIKPILEILKQGIASVAPGRGMPTTRTGYASRQRDPSA